MSKVEKTNKTEKIFFPLMEDKGLDSTISNHFGHAPIFGVYYAKTATFETVKNKLNHTNPNHTPIDQIQELVNPSIIFAKGIGSKAIARAKEKGIEIKTSNFSTVREIIEHYDELQEQESNCGE